MRMLVKMSSFSVALLVMMLLNAQPNKGSFHSQCNSSMDECFDIMDVDTEVLLDTEISMRQLAAPGGKHVTDYTGIANKPAICNKVPYSGCLPKKNVKHGKGIYGGGHQPSLGN